MGRHLLEEDADNRNLATVETRGKPGNVKIYDDGNGFHVVCMEAQWEYGKCFQSRRGRIGPYDDTPQHIIRWFKQCLNELGQLNDLRTIAFPYKIACGKWSIYFELIERFAELFDKNVIIIRKL